MAIFGSVVLVLAIIVAIVFSLLVLITGKGDAMSGGGSVRTTYKGKATFDDIMSRATLIMGISFMALVLVYNIVINRAEKQATLDSVKSSVSKPEANVPSAPSTTGTSATNSPAETKNAPAPAPAAANNAPATNAPAPAATNTPDTNKPAK